MNELDPEPDGEEGLVDVRVNGGRIPGQRGGVKTRQCRRGAQQRHRSRSAGDDLAGLGIDDLIG